MAKTRAEIQKPYRLRKKAEDKEKYLRLERERMYKRGLLKKTYMFQLRQMPHEMYVTITMLDLVNSCFMLVNGAFGPQIPTCTLSSYVSLK